MSNQMIPIGMLFDIEKGELQSTKCTPGEYDFITAAEDWKTHNEYSHECEALIFAAAASGSLGRTHYVDGKFTTSDLCYILTPKNETKYPLNISFYHFVFNSLRPTLVTATKSGTSKESINQTNFKKYEIPYFDIELQDLWIGKLKNTLGLKDLLGAELTHQQTLLNKLRQQILQEGIEGKLTADWRAENPNVEPASELLKRIAAEKAQLAKDKKIKPQKPLPPITDEEKSFELPQGWVWSRIGEITSVVTSGSRNWQSLYSDTGATFIRSQDIKLDRLCYANRAFVDISKAKEGIRTLVNQHDWLIIITGANVGKCAYLDESIEEAYVSQHVALMRPMLKEIGIFGHYWLIAELGGRGLLSKFIYGDKPGLNLPQLRSLLIPIIPIAEQQAIVTKIKKMLALCDQLEAQITQNQTHAEELMQAALKEAFSHGAESTAGNIPQEAAHA